MELSKTEIQSIKDLLGIWQGHPEIEVESTFGPKGTVNKQTFLRVVSRLKSKGFDAIPLEDRLTVSMVDTPGQPPNSNKIRFTLSGSGLISQYCIDDKMIDKPFIAIIKDTNTTKEKNISSTIDLKDYDVRVKARREIELAKDDPRVVDALKDWNMKQKYFRLIRRWRFQTPDSYGILFDLSITRSTKKIGSRAASQLKFQDQPLSTMEPNYEIEVELDHSVFPEKSDANLVFKALIRGIGEILRGIQGCPILIRNSIRQNVLNSYNTLAKTDRFRGVAPITLEVKNMALESEPSVPNIRSNYNVTDKADGLRVHGFTDESGELFMIDMAFNIYRTGYRNAGCKNALLDGEYITQDIDGNFIQELLFFDIYFMDNKDVTKYPFKESKGNCRYDFMNEWFSTWNSNGGPVKLVSSSTLLLGLKTFYFTNPEDSKFAIFEKATTILNKKQMYNTDGLIFTPNMLPLPSSPGVSFPQQFKWKPSKDNSVDFLVHFIKDPKEKDTDKVNIMIHPDTQETIYYKTLKLYVGSSEDPAYKNPRATILNDLPLPISKGSGPGHYKRNIYKPVPFVPIENPDPNAAICYLKTEIDPITQELYVSTEKGEPIHDKSIIEMRYDATQSQGWRWKPMRIRVDKTERLLKGTYERTLNSEKTAESIWNSIHEPITEYMIRNGSEVPSDLEIAEYNLKPGVEKKKYFERSASEHNIQKVNGLRKYHNIYIKDEILYKYVSPISGNQEAESTARLLDLSVGKASDMQRWRRSKLSFVLGVDIVADNIINRNDGAYRRLLDTKVRAYESKDPLPIPPIFFVSADSSLRLMDGSGAINEEEGDILRCILGNTNPIGTIPPAIEKYGKDALKDGADIVSCMYSLHYFFETSEKFNGFLQNISDTLKIGGHFIGTNFDGNSVFDLLRNVKTGMSVSGMDNQTTLWEIEKLYDDMSELPSNDSGFGIPVNVYFISIGITHKEYLVPWSLFIKKMKSIGCELVESKMYGSTYNDSLKTKDADKFRMNKTVQEFSFLNRWYIFKRTSQGSGEIGKILDEDEMILLDNTTLDTAETPNTNMAMNEEDVINESVESSGPSALPPSGPSGPAVASAAVAPSVAPSVAPAAVAPSVVPSVGPAAVEQALGSKAAILTVPVEKLYSKKYKMSDVFKINESSSENESSSILPKEYASYASRHMAPNAPFRIIDTTDPTDTTEYPSITHFLSGMKLKYASRRPELAKVFSSAGTIHKSFLEERLAKQKGKQKPIPQKLHNELVLNEKTAVETEEIRLLNTSEVGFDEGLWAPRKEKLLREALLQRLTNDKWFCVIVSTVLSNNRIFLYLDKNAAEHGSELGGILLSGKLSGQNRYGFLIQELATTFPDALKACLELPDPF